jgi:hypothetical protein
MTVAKELSKYKLDLVEFRRLDGTEVAFNRQSNIHFSVRREMRIMNCYRFFFVHKRIISVVKRLKFVSDRMSYMVLRGHWCDIIVLNIYAPTEDKTDNGKDSFYGKLECVRDKFPEYHTKILFGDCGAK